MTERLIGLETEYGFTVPEVDHETCCSVLDCLIHRAGRKLVHLPSSQGSGIFLVNGSRLYVDTGGHPEFCTPEVVDPWELVRYICAGDRILHRLAEETASVERVPEVVLFKSNVDYGGGCTWGCHENFGNKAPKTALPQQLIPHLVTRIVFSGAGGLNPHCQGIEFVLSPRACHLESATCISSTSSRGIYHYKDEPLSSYGWSRLHLLCGESVMSHRAMLLKAGTTALVVAMVEGRLDPGLNVRLKSPIEAMHILNTDPSGCVPLPLADGGEMTALAIQRHYLELAEAHLRHDCMPAWTPELCRCWRETLDLLERGPDAVSRMLDWSIKHALYHDRIRRRGLSPEHMKFWNQVLAKFKVHWDADIGALTTLTPERILGAKQVQSEFETRRRELGLSWEDAPEVLQLRAELCELEMRFSRLGPKGLFNALDHGAHLDHTLPNISDSSIERAIDAPPARGRAGVRGRLIREYHGQGRCSADWAGVSDLAGRHIDLSDPFIEQVPEWGSASGVDASRIDVAGRILAEVDRCYNRGDYELAWSALQPLRQMRLRIGHVSAERTFQLTAWVQSRRGYIREALEALDEISMNRISSGNRPARYRELARTAGLRPGPMAQGSPQAGSETGAPRRGAGAPLLDLDQIFDLISTLRFDGLAPNPEPLWLWIRQAEALLAQPGDHSVPGRFAFLGHKAALLVHEKRLQEAHDVLIEACVMAEAHNSHSRVLARNLCDLAEVHRQREEPAKSRECLDHAQRIQTTRHYEGDYAEFNLPRRAKLQKECARAKAHLHQARLIQRRLQHRVGMAKTVLLQARLFPSVWHNQRRKRILLAWQREVPMLRECPLMSRILANWQLWVGGENPCLSASVEERRPSLPIRLLDRSMSNVHHSTFNAPSPGGLDYFWGL